MNPLVGIQGPQTLQPSMTWQQGMPGLMGNVYSPLPSLMNHQPGDWSQVAYQMAGSPNQGPAPAVPVPSMPPGVNGGTSSGGGSSLGGTALGILGALAKNPALLKSAGSGISSLWNGITGGSSAASGLGGATAYGTNAAVAPASTLTSELPATATGTYAAPAAAAAAPAVSGLMGGSALGAGAPGVFASGNAAAGSAGTSAGLTGAGSLAAAAPFLAGMGVIYGLGSSAQATNDQGNAAMKGWMAANGVTYKPASWNTNVGQNTFGTQQASHGGQSPGTFMGANGQPMTEKQAETAIVQWARAHGLPTGNLNYTGG